MAHTQVASSEYKHEADLVRPVKGSETLLHAISLQNKVDFFIFSQLNCICHQN